MVDNIITLMVILGLMLLVYYESKKRKKNIIKEMQVDDNINILIDDFSSNMKNNIELKKVQNKMRLIKIIEYISYIILIIYLLSQFILLTCYFQNERFAIDINFKQIEKENLYSLIFKLTIASFIIYLYSQTNYKKSKEILKKYIYNQFLKNLNYDLKWDDEQSEVANSSKELAIEYKIANFNKIQHNELLPKELKFEDYISGIYKEKFIISIADFKEYIGKRSNTLYEGIFCKVKINKEILNDIRITNDNKSSLLLEKDYIVTTMSEEFNSNFIILANDGYQISKCISSKSIEIIEEFYYNSKINFDISIINDEIFFRFRTIDSMEPHIWKNIVDELMLKEYANIIMFVIKLSEEINNIS